MSIDNVVRILSITSQNDLKLCGHEGFVTDISWFPRLEKNDHLLDCIIRSNSSDMARRIKNASSKSTRTHGFDLFRYVGVRATCNENINGIALLIPQENLSKSKHVTEHMSILEHRRLA